MTLKVITEAYKRVPKTLPAESRYLLLGDCDRAEWSFNLSTVYVKHFLS